MHDWGVSEWWMPSIVGALFFVPYVFACFMLHQAPPPSKEDVLQRGERTAMYHEDRLGFFKSFAPGLLACWGLMALLTSYRDYRDTFQIEIFESLGYTEIGIFSLSETIVASIVTIMVALVVLVRSNYWGLAASFGLVFAGALVLAAGQTAHHAGVSGMVYMVMTGYVGCVLE